MTTGRQKLTLILVGAAILLVFTVFLLLKGGGSASTDYSGAERETSFEEDLLDIDPNDPEAIATIFELRFEKIRQGTARIALAEFKLDGFSLKPLATLNSVVESECLPRVRGLKAQGQKLPSENLQEAVPAHLLHGDPVTICRDLVVEGLGRTRPGLDAIDGARLWQELKKVDSLSASFFQGKSTEGRAGLKNFEAYIAARQSALNDSELDSTLFGVQDDHTRLGYNFEDFLKTEAAGMSLNERLIRYEAMAGDFEKKNGVALHQQDPEPRDHLNRALRLLELDENYDEDTRYELIKKMRGEKAARLDQQERKATGAERQNIASFETERDQLFSEITAKPGTAAYKERAAEIESQLTKKYFE